MSRFFSEKYSSLEPYTPGEQPQGKKYLKINTNESPFPPSPIASRLARQAAGDLQLYSDPTCRDLCAVAAQTLGVKPEQLLFTNGSDDVLNFAFMAFCDQTHPVVFPDVTYGFYPVFAALHRIPYEEIPLSDDFTVNVEDYCGIGKTVFLANPNAPTGIALSRKAIERIVASNPDNVVVVDEAYVDFGAESAVPLIDRYENLLVCQTTSKSRSLAGGRLGYAIGNEELIRDLNTLKYSTNPYNINRMTMAAGIGAFADTRYFEENCKKIIKTRENTVKELEKRGFSVLPSSSNFLFATHPEIGGEDLYRALKERDVLIRHFSADRLDDYNRITVGSDEQMAAFFTELDAVLEEWL